MKYKLINNTTGEEHIINTPNKQTVYLPIKVEDDRTFLITEEEKKVLQYNYSIDFYKDGKCIYTPVFITQTNKESKELEHLIIERLEKQEVFVFTPEQLHEYTANVIEQAFNATISSLDKVEE